ncbi:MAG: GAF domain-containing protein [Propionibacteriaceae bacterium]
MTELLEQATAALTAQQRLQRLLAANRSIVGELSLPAVLRRIVDTARDVAGARYAALGVIGPDRQLEQFLFAGMDAETVATIGELPKGRGLLGTLLADPRPIRVARIADDQRSSGLPAGHPPMTSFLGVPVRSRDAVFGNLYLTERVDGGQFTDEDEELVLALAATAGIAIDNARLYEDSRRRQEWLRASGEISRRLVQAEFDHRDVLQQIAGSVRRLANADVVSVVLPVEGAADDLEVIAASGRGEHELRGMRYPREDSVAWQAMVERRGQRIDDAHHHPGVYLHLRAALPVSEVLALPLSGEGGSLGAIVAARASQTPFTETDLEMAEAFAGQAALALELAAARADQQRLEVLEDRDRIARDLHDHVIQRLFSVGLSVQSTAMALHEGPARDRLVRTVDELDDTIRRIRTTIFALQDAHGGQALRRTALGVIDQVTPMLSARPDLQFVGALDTISEPQIVAAVEAVLRESLTNVAKHAHADDVRVELRTDGAELTLTVADDGIGLTDPGRRSGLVNLRTRAEQLGGHLALDDNPEGGLRLRWTIPLP